MKNRGKILISFVIIGVAMIATWHWRCDGAEQIPAPRLSRHAVETPSFPSGQGGFASRKPPVTLETTGTVDRSEWARHRIILKGANDVESLVRAYKETNDCRLYHSARHELELFLKDERAGDLSNETQATLESMDATSAMYLAALHQTEVLCAGSNPDALAAVYPDALLKAALSGAPDAQSCFVLDNVASLQVPSRETYADAEKKYLKYAETFTQNALERGDPFVADRALYRYIASEGVHPSELDTQPLANPYLVWRGARLASLRALPDQSQRLEGDLALFRKLNVVRPQDIRRADAWAKATYQRDFAGKPPLDLDTQAPCYSAPYLARPVSVSGGNP